MPPEQSQNPTLADVISGAIEARLDDMYTAMPARVTKAINPNTYRISAQPTISQIYYDETGTRRFLKPPVIPDIPVVFPGSGVNWVSFPIEVGDMVLLVFANSPMDEWKNTLEGVVNPNSEHRFKLTDAIAIPGLMPSRRSVSTPEIDQLGTVIQAPRLFLGGAHANQGVVRAMDLRQTVIDVLTNPTVVEALGAAIVSGSMTGLTTALVAHFVANPPDASSVVKAL